MARRGPGSFAPLLFDEGFEVADFCGPVEVKAHANPLKGRGLFAARTVEPGELLLMATPLAACDLSQLGPGENAHNALARSLLADCPPALLKRVVSDLKGVSSGRETTVDLLEALAHTNAFQLPESHVVALYHMPSFLNHDCAPNTALLFIRDVLVLRAGARLEQGTEVCIRYFACPDMSVAQRRAESATWGFQCQCEMCLLEAALPGFAEFHARVLASMHEQCKRFFQRSAARNVDDVCDALRALVDQVEARLAVSLAHAHPRFSHKFRALFASGYQVYRAALERQAAARALITMAQDVVLGMLDATEPGSFEHCKSATIRLHYARDVLGRHSRRFHRASLDRLEACALRYGLEDEGFNAQLCERLDAAVDHPDTKEWCLELT
jgi:hypothetical protein